jgi:hypothetical protein
MVVSNQLRAAAAVSQWWSPGRRLRRPEQCCARRHGRANQAAGSQLGTARSWFSGSAVPELFKRRNVLIRPVSFPFPDHQHLFLCDPSHSTRSLQAVSATGLITAFSIRRAPDTSVWIRGNWVTRVLFMPCIAEGSNCVLQQSVVFSVSWGNSDD